MKLPNADVADSHRALPALPNHVLDLVGPSTTEAASHAFPHSGQIRLGLSFRDSGPSPKNGYAGVDPFGSSLRLSNGRKSGDCLHRPPVIAMKDEWLMAVHRLADRESSHRTDFLAVKKEVAMP